jgi:DNA (cytosine-5)-methyltransferase 1
MKISYIDLFCGIGAFRVAMNNVAQKQKIHAECVFSSDIDPTVQKIYYDNFGDRPFGDITKINENFIPDHDILFAGFPCQPFSIIGKGNGFTDTRGTLFFDIARILSAKKPRGFVLENVKQLVSHNNGKTFSRILSILNELGYTISYKILNALDFGLPQKRERVFIIGTLNPLLFDWKLTKRPMLPLSSILEKNISNKFFASKMIQDKRKAKHKPLYTPSIWHENKSGNISSYPYSCALRAGASYNYLLVDGIRRLTPREMFRLQGFPDTYKITVTDSQARKQAGNALPVNAAEAILEKFIPIIYSDMYSGVDAVSDVKVNYG